MKHTPGPWHRHGLHVHASYEDGNGNRRHYAVADALQHSGLATGEADANARLIAAAPNMLKALKTFELEISSRFAKGDAGLADMSEQLRVCVLQARAAIKGAEGEK